MPIISNFPGGNGAGGGGLALAAVSGIETLTASGKVYVKWTDPADIVVEEAPLATWAGTLLVRKAGSMPTSRRDGVIVVDSKTRDAYQGTYFCDSGLSNGTTYYYKFFPYTTSNTYTDSTENEFSATPNMVAPGNVSSMSATENGNGKIAIKWTDPEAAVVNDGITLATWASTKVVYKTGGYPTSPEDGTLAINSTTRNAYSSTPLTISGLSNGATYYFSFFPVSAEGAVNSNTANRVSGVPNRITIASVPSQSGSLTYTGSSQSPTWANYDSSKMTIGGTTSSTNAGSYNATFTPKDDYRWSDESTTAKTVQWSIAKAAGSLSISPTSLTLNMSSPTGKITVTRAGDGTITATSNNQGVATVSVSGNTVTVNNVNQSNGSAVITIKVAAGTNHTAPSDKTCNVTASFISKTLNDNEWSAISSVSSTGANYWAVGDRKAVAINGTVGTKAINATYYVYILGFNHNSSREGNGITFGGFKTALSGGTDICLVDDNYNSYSTGGQKWFNMNHSANTNSGGWKGCDLRYDVLGSTNTNNGDATATTATSPVSGTLMAALPSALRAVMKPMNIYTDNTGGGSDTASYVTKSVDYLPLLAEYEIFGTRSYANSAEQNYQQQYQYYKNGNSRVKYRHTATSSSAIWWERSPAYYNGIYFCFVGTNGTANGTDARYSYGLAPAFRI